MEGFTKKIERLPDATGSDSTGYIHSIETMAAVDGPGLRYLIFMAGCAWRCLYCHNPDTWKIHKNQARNIEDLLQDIGKYSGFLRSAGGLTVSGGEPLGQAAFVGRLFREVKKRYGLHTTLDTQGNLAANVDDAWWEAVDLVLLDIKHSDEAGHRKLTSFPLQPTLDAAKRLSDLGKPLWIRHVLVPGITDMPEHLEKLADIIAGLKTVQRVEILPFHQMAEHKWQELGRVYPLKGWPTPDEAAVEAARAIVRSRGLTVY